MNRPGWTPGYNVGRLPYRPIGTPASSAYAISFDGINDYVTTGQHAELEVTTDWTIVAWINRDVAGADHVISFYDTGTASYFNALLLAISYLDKIVVIVQDGVSVSETIESTGTVGTGWHHIAIVHAGGDTKIYIDGALDSTQAQSDPVYPATADPGLSIGRYVVNAAPASGAYFEGLIDEFAIFSSDKSGQISGWYNGGTGALISSGESGLELLYRMDEINTGNTPDASANTLDGAVTGATVVAGIL